MKFRTAALQALLCPDPDEKCAQVRALFDAVSQCPEGLQDWASEQAMPAPTLAGRPALPRLVDPGQVAHRSPFTAKGRAALVHAICHIEFNAINLALDAVARFDAMPAAYYQDWLRVAHEEAYHFGLLRDALAQVPPEPAQTRPWQYGDFDAHDGLWLMCEKTASDIVARMALVPRTLEARGLDATPLIQAKLQRVGTPDALHTCSVLDIVLRDEVGHVAIGNHWYRVLCAQKGLDPVAHYRLLVSTYQAPKLKPPFNESARRKAGFTDLEISFLIDA